MVSGFKQTDKQGWDNQFVGSDRGFKGCEQFYIETEVYGRRKKGRECRDKSGGIRVEESNRCRLKRLIKIIAEGEGRSGAGKGLKSNTASDIASEN